MQIQFLYPYWGKETWSPLDFLSFVKAKGFNGVEINFSQDETIANEFYALLSKEREDNPGFIYVGQQVLGSQQETPQEYLSRALERLEYVAQFEPNFINSHTGKDHFSFSDNCKIIEAIENFASKCGIPIYHEIHRGRFTFHSTSTLTYLEVFPNIQLVGDFSHWCVVSESLLQDQKEVIERVIPNITHLHARVGTEQASQVSDPFAPEWSDHLVRFTALWKSVVKYHQPKNSFTITPEFGPFPYMPQAPYTKQSLADQDLLNIRMKDHLKQHLL